MYHQRDVGKTRILPVFDFLVITQYTARIMKNSIASSSLPRNDVETRSMHFCTSLRLVWLSLVSKFVLVTYVPGCAIVFFL